MKFLTDCIHNILDLKHSKHKEDICLWVNVNVNGGNAFVLTIGRNQDAIDHLSHCS